MKVYVVTSGSYSDYGIEGVFSSKENAEKFREEFDKTEKSNYGKSNDVMEWEVDEKLGMVAKPFWAARMEKSSGGALPLKDFDQGVRLVEANKRNETPQAYHERNSFTGFMEEFIYVVSYVSFDHAVKVAAETRQAMLRGDYSGVEPR